MGKTCHVTDADGVRMGREHDGDGFGQLLDNPNLRRRGREYDVDVRSDQRGGKLRQLLDRFRPLELDGNILASNPVCNALTRLAWEDVGPSRRKPIRGTFALCCARAVNGHAVVPPSSVMNSRRRIIQSPRRRAFVVNWE